MTSRQIEIDRAELSLSARAEIAAGFGRALTRKELAELVGVPPSEILHDARYGLVISRYHNGRFEIQPEEAANYIRRKILPPPRPVTLSPIPAREKPARPGVYFLRHEQLVKIGMAGDIRKRVAAIQYVCPVAPSLIFEILTADRAEAKQLEASLHRRFASSRVRGEWFTREPLIATFIEEEQQRRSGSR